MRRSRQRGQFRSGLSFFDLIAITLSDALLLAGVHLDVAGVPPRRSGVLERRVLAEQARVRLA